MPSGMQRVRLEAAHLGTDVDSAPSQVNPGKALLVQNYLTGEAGRTRARGSIRKAAIAHGAIGRALAGGWVGVDRILAGYVNLMDHDHTVERHVAPRAGSDGTDLATAQTGANNLKLVDVKGSTNSVTNVSSGADDATRRSITPWGRGTRVGRFVYGFGLDTANDIVTPTASFTIGQNDSGGYERLTYMLRWRIDDPTTAPVVYLCGPYGGQDMRFYYNKLFALGGRQPETGGGFVESNVVWYTREWSANHHNLGFSPLDDALNVSPAPSGTNFWPSSVPLVGAPGDCNQGASSASAMWFEEDATTTPKRLNIPGDEQDYGVAFAFVGRNLGILKRRSAVLLVGGDPDTWTLRTAVQGVGCMDPRSVVEANEGAYFASQQGYVYWDGVQFHNVSNGVHRTLTDSIHRAVGDDAAAGGFVVGERLDRDFILVTVGRYFWSSDGNADPAAPDVYFCGLYHIPSNSWTQFDSDLWSTTDNAPQEARRTENRVVAFGHLNAHQIQNVTQPERVAEAERGIDVGDLSIETKWHSRVVELAMPFERVAIKRVIVDYEWIKDGANTPDTPTFDGPTVTLCDGSGTALGGDGTFKLPYGEDDGNEVLRQRWTQDVNVEASDLQVRIEYSDPGTDVALVQSSILDVFIEYQVAHERRQGGAGII